MKFARIHLIKVLNLDFSKPTKKLKQMAESSNIDLSDPIVIEEFKLIQTQTLQDVQRLKEGKPPRSEKEI